MKKKDDVEKITVSKETVEKINKINSKYKELCVGYGLDINEVSFALIGLVSTLILSAPFSDKEKQVGAEGVCLQILTHVMEVIGESKNGN